MPGTSSSAVQAIAEQSLQSMDATASTSMASLSSSPGLDVGHSAGTDDREPDVPQIIGPSTGGSTELEAPLTRSKKRKHTLDTVESESEVAAAPGKSSKTPKKRRRQPVFFSSDSEEDEYEVEQIEDHREIVSSFFSSFTQTT